MRDALDEQIEAYETLLPKIKAEHGSVWAIVAHNELVSIFTDFPAAARYAEEYLTDEPVVIRHTDEKTETAPFVYVEG